MPTDLAPDPDSASAPDSVDVTIRPGDESDLPAVADVYLAAREAAVPLMPVGIHPPDDVRAWVGGWDLATDEVWLAVDPDTDRVLGFAHLSPTWLDGLYVDPSAQRRGIGRTLLDLAMARRADGFCLWVFASNVPARSLYAAAGLVELEHTDGSDNEERAPDVRMAYPGTSPLAFFRGLIDDVDDQLGRLLARRAALTAAVQPLRDGGRDEAREAEIADRLAQLAPALGRARVARIVDAVIRESLDAVDPAPG